MGALTTLLLVGLCGVIATQSMPLTSDQPQQSQRSVPTPKFIQVPEFDYSRFYFGNNNFPDRKSSQASYDIPPQWTLPRQLAPKFKRESSYSSHDKRLDEQFPFDDFINMSPSRFEWNFNRL